MLNWAICNSFGEVSTCTKMNLFLYLFPLFVVGVSSQWWETYKAEPACSAAGGICVDVKYCKNVPEKGLCPDQQSRAVECCHECKFWGNTKVKSRKLTVSVKNLN